MEVYEQYKNLLFKSTEEEVTGVYDEQINAIEKFFIWEFVIKNLAKEDITKMKEVRQLSVTEVFDYLTICKQDKTVQEMRSSKNIIPL